ncbi:tetratricopeptide repeat protein [candidate division KSB1 bacterium]|nr:tetratricopeptide repeat protein [candidate division KSB1 bacterium]
MNTNHFVKFIHTHRGYLIVGSCSIIVAALLGYAHTLHYGFHFDDMDDILRNPAIKNLADIAAMWRYAPTRVVAIISLALNYHFHQYDVLGYHLANISIHIITALVLWLFVRTILKTLGTLAQQDQRWLALLVALIFVSHPIQTQAVTYIVQRMASLATLFFLLSITTFALAHNSDNSIKRRNLLLACSFLSGVLAMFTKPIAFTLPFVILLYEYAFVPPENRWITHKRNRLRLIPIMALALIVPALLKFNFSVVFRTIIPQQGNTFSLNGKEYLFTQFRVILNYIRLLLFPLDQNFDYDVRISTHFFDPAMLLSFAILSLLLAVSILQWKKNRLFSFGMLWFFITLSVESSIIPIPNVMYEHRLYLPGIGFFIAVLSLVYDKRLGCLKPHITKAAVMAVPLLIIMTHQRNRVWENEYTLWNDVVLKSPHKARGWNNRGRFFMDRYDFKAAISDFNKAIAINPAFFAPYFNRGYSYQQNGQLDFAEADFRRTLSLAPAYHEAFNCLGVIQAFRNQNDSALVNFNKALDCNPTYVEALINRGIILLKNGSTASAIKDFQQSLKLAPDNPQALFYLGLAYQQSSDNQAAIQAFSIYLSKHPPVSDVLLYRGKSYLELGDHTHAQADLNAAVKLKPNDARSWFYRGKNQFILGSFRNALSDFERTLSIDKQMYECYYFLGLILNELGNPDAAMDYIDSLLIHEPKHPKGLVAKGNLLTQQKKNRQSLTFYDLALNINPQYADAYYERGTAFMKLNNMAKAISDFSAAVKIDSNLARAYANRAECYYRTHQYQLARNDLAKVKTLNGMEDPELSTAMKKVKGASYHKTNYEKSN